jgi:hypothetical protein
MGTSSSKPQEVSPLMRQWALNQVQEVLHRERRDIDDEHQCILLWASMLKERTTSEKARAQAREWHLNTREELLKRQQAAINELDAASHKILSDAMELYATTEARANTTIKQEEELAVRIRAVVESEQVVLELEQRLQEREGLNDIKLGHKLETLATH